jgi:uncharacterized protein (TIGR00251 family)
VTVRDDADGGETTADDVGQVTLCLHVQARARETEVSGWHGDAIKVRLSAPPVDGAANQALIDFLAQRVGVPRAAVRIVAGHGSRRKRVTIAGVRRAEVLRRLGVM